jgi:hypothetical protein
MIFCEINFYRGAGLGTRLFPWARGELFAHEHGCKIIKPRWVQPRIGPLIRGGIDLKSYATQILLLNQFKDASYYTSNILRRYKNKLTEGTLNIEDIELYKNDNENHKISFIGDRGRFLPLNGMHEIVKEKILNITNEKRIKFANDFKGIPIAVNVRSGNDFVEVKDIGNENREAVKTPISWFINTINIVREEVGYKAEILLVSDGTRDYLKPLIDLGNVHFVRPGCAISDLLILSNAKILVRPRGSSFSAWASFLGQATTLSPQGGSMENFNLKNAYGRFIGEFIPENPSQAALNSIKSAIKE